MAGKVKEGVLFTVDEIVSATGGRVLRRGNRPVTGVSTDSRTLKPCDLFVALSGPNFDGTAFVKDAVQAGACGAIVPGDSALSVTDEDFLLIGVDDTLMALQRLARFHRLRINPLIVGVTGSNGKTTTKEMIASVMSIQGGVLKTEGNLNNHIGVPLTLLKLTPVHKAAVVEMGMNAPGEIRALSAIACPDVAVITNVAEAHLEGLGSIENIARAKVEILDGLKQEGTAVLNGDDAVLMEAARGYEGTVITFGLGDANDVRATDVIVNHQGQPTFILHHKDEAVAVHLAHAGRHNVMNALASAAAAIGVGLTLPGIRQGLEAAPGVSMRMEVKSLAGMRLIVDCYNANPGSMRAAFGTLSEIRGRKWAVLGDMLELGVAAKDSHMEIGRLAAALGLCGLIVLGDHAESVARGAREGGMDDSRIHIRQRHEDAAAVLLEYATGGDTVLIKGSRGAKLEKVVEAMEKRHQGAR